MIKQLPGTRPIHEAFRRPCARPQEDGAQFCSEAKSLHRSWAPSNASPCSALASWRPLCCRYLEPKHAAMMDRPDRCRWCASEMSRAFYGL